jgi:glycine dehydrogenase subunit 1
MSGENKEIAYPYIPNALPHIRDRMLQRIGVKSIEELYEMIPERLRFKGKMDLPGPLHSEYELRRHVEAILQKNTSAAEVISFLGGGCYQHFVPAVCDEINQRYEFLTAYSGRAYEDHGRYQALFEFASMMGELLNLEVVSVPTYDGYQAAATALRMAGRITGRKYIIVSRAISPDKLSRIANYSSPFLKIKVADFDPNSGQTDIKAVERLLDTETAAIYFDTPNFFGCLETGINHLTTLAHQAGALCVVGVEPLTLGVLRPPADYGADIVCGEIQSLGIHMQFGGGQAGFIATRDEERFVMEYPTRLIGLLPTRVPGEHGFGEVAMERTSFLKREGGKEWLGTMANLWGITAAVYLALMGPQGMKEIGEGIFARTSYAIRKLAQVKGIRILHLSSPHFREFVVNFDESGKTVEEINALLAQRGIFGGHSLRRHFPEMGESALYCVTEIHTQAQIDLLADTLKEILQS